MKQKRRPEVLKPGLKMQTPHEKKVVATHGKQTADMWASLFDRNKWKPHK